jgi:hypothetical protein
MNNLQRDVVGLTICAVAQAYSIPESALRSPVPPATLVEARRVSMQLLRERGLHPALIARVLHLHPTTVHHHLTLIRDQPTPEEAAMLATLRRAAIDAARAPARARRP